MALKSLNRPIGGLCVAFAAFSTVGQTNWRLPVTIETLVDVPAHAEGAARQVRGVLYISPDEQPFTVKKGQRFLMVKIHGEGGCRIEFEKKQYNVNSCPWLEGFTDHQEDIFKVVSGRSGRTVRR